MHASSLAQWILVATPLLFSGCRAPSTVTPVEGAVEPAGEGALVAQGQGDYQGPPHLFTPRPHPPRAHADPPAVDLARLPKLVNRIDRCYGSERPPELARPQSRPKRIAPKYKQVQYGSASPPSPTGGAMIAGGAASGRAGAGSPVQSKTTPSKSGGDAKAEGLRGPTTAAQPASSAPMADALATSRPREADTDRSSARLDAREGKRDERAREEEQQQAKRPQAIAVEEDSDEPRPVRMDDPRDQYKDWGAAIYLSNDDTMSLSSAQRVIFAIEKFLPLPIEHIRPHELLNYFSFETAPVAARDDFSVRADMSPDPSQAGIYNLALAIAGRPVDLQARRNANVTFVVDRSGSMADEGRMDYLKRGMTKMSAQLKRGDLVNVVLFDHEECTPIENFVVGRDRPEILQKAIDKMRPRGSTNVHLGLTRGYALADAAHQPTYNNRVVLVTDALANTGDTDPRTMAMVAKYYDARKIRLSGVGVGREFNDELLDKLTERGKGAYVFLGSEAEVDAVFGPRFISLLETTAMDVHFQLHLPPSLRMNVFYGEESSVVKEDVQAIHYFANTSQLFLADVMARGAALRPQDQIMLTIEYEDPETGTRSVEEQAFTLGEIVQEDAYNVRKGRLLIGWADRLAQLATRPQPPGRGVMAESWDDPQGWQACDTGRGELSALAQGMSDPETSRVLGLWDKFCARYERPRHPVRREPAAQPSAWPGARG